jgi:protein-disulfide isomerase
MSKGQGGGDLRRFYIVFAIVALVGIGAVGYSVASTALGTPVAEPVDLEGVTDDMRRLNEMAVPVAVGEEDAPATIVVFGDYLCNHCAAFSLQVRPQLEAAFVETGRARLLFYDFPLNPGQGTFLAARAARCAGDQGRFWDYHDALYRNQRSWAFAEDQVDAFIELAEGVVVDTGEFRGCLRSDAHAREVTANLELAKALGLPGTPAVLVGTEGGMSRRVPDYSFRAVEETLNEILGEQG